MKTPSIYLIAALCIVAPLSASNGPLLSIPERIPGTFGIPVAVPVLFASDGTGISAIVFSVNFAEGCLHFDDSDTDPADGIPDDILFDLPVQFIGSVSYDPEDTDGELDFVVADFGPPLASLPDGEIVFIILTPTCQPELTSIIAPVGFSQNPPVSFGDTNGQGVPGTSVDGWVEIGVPIFLDSFESGDTTAWSATVPPAAGS